MTNGPAVVVTIATRRRPLWRWVAIGWARRLHRLTGRLLAWAEGD